MKTLAAILVEAGKPLELVDLQIPALRSGQVLVEVAYSGVCHTQLLEMRGHRGPDPFLPHCLGHEGSGIVRELGANVQKCAVEDRVVLSWIKGSGADVPGTVYEWNGRNVNAGGVTTFSNFSVVSENRLTVLPAEVALSSAAWLGCAIPTGIGAAWNSANVQCGQSVVVFGTGGIGLFAVAGAALRGAAPVIAVDVNPLRLATAERLGATDLIHAAVEDPVEAVRRICNRGADIAIEASGRPAVMRQALAAVRSQGGTVVVIGNARYGEQLEIDPRELNQGKRLLGTWGGDCQPDRDLPEYGQLLASGRLKLESFGADVYSLHDIQRALDDLEAGRVTRPLIDMGKRSEIRNSK